MPVCQTTIEPGSFCEKHGTINRHVRMMISTSSPNFGTGPVRAGQQFSETALCDWMARSVDGYAGPLTANGGQSNPRHLLHTPDRSYVLRRKPPSPTLRGAHAIEREFQVISALASANFPVLSQVEPKSGVFEHRSAAYFRYVSTGAQNIALCRPAWAECRSALEEAGRVRCKTALPQYPRAPFRQRHGVRNSYEGP
jgi:hypothetical protein